MKIMTDIEVLAYKKWKKANRKKAVIWLALTGVVILTPILFSSPLIFIPISIGLFSFLSYLFWQYRGTKKAKKQLLEEWEREK